MDIIFQKIQTILSQTFDIDQDKIFPQTHFVEDVGMDSLDLVELIMSLEADFNIEIADDNLTEIQTVEDVCNYVEQHLSNEIAGLNVTDERPGISEDKNYDENAILTSYIWHHYAHLMNGFERKVGNEILKLQKAEAYSRGDLSKFEELKERYGCNKDLDVTKALKDGYDAFQEQTRDRLLLDNEDKIFINRCPSCKRIVRTPKAKQCLWCGRSWHHSGKQQPMTLLNK